MYWGIAHWITRKDQDADDNNARLPRPSGRRLSGKDQPAAQTESAKGVTEAARSRAVHPAAFSQLERKLNDGGATPTTEDVRRCPRQRTVKNSQPRMYSQRDAQDDTSPGCLASKEIPTNIFCVRSILRPLAQDQRWRPYAPNTGDHISL